MHEIDMMLEYQLEGRNQEARELSDKLENIGPDKILDAHGNNTQDIWFRHCFNRGWFIVQDGDYQEGCKLLESGRFLNTYGSPPLKTDAPLFNPNEHNIKGKSIIISLEGGFGDEIIHARFATRFKDMGASHVYLAAAPELVSVFSRIRGVDKVILRNQAHLVPHDYWIPGFSAGWTSGCTFKDFPDGPYLSANPDSVEIWKSIITSDKIKVGIRWAGNPKFEHQQYRRFPENFITNLAKYDELQIYSLQKDHNLIQLPENVHDLQYFLISWEDTMAAIANMDIVISSCTSIAHLAAAMGKETWVITPILPYHTWAPGAPKSTTTPYYKCVRVFRQKEPRKWNDTFQKLYKDLEKKYKLKHIKQPNEDRVIKRVNLGCGLNKINGFVNVDKLERTKPDQLVNLNVTPWPWKDDEFDHIFAKDILEHLGDTNEEFINIIKEMYRVSANGAIWEIQVPHWRCDIALDDLTHKRVITVGMLNLFDRQYIMNTVKQGMTETLLAFDHGIDIQICDVQFDYTLPWKQRIKENQISQEELTYALNHLNNVAMYTKILIQVHKPVRVNDDELTRVVNERQQS